MNQRTIDGILVTRPTRADVQGLKVGDMAPDVFGAMSLVVEVFAQQDDCNGRAFVCFYTAFGTDGGRMSGSMNEGEPVATLPAGSRWSRTADYPTWRADA